MVILLKILCDDSVITERIAMGTLRDLENSIDVVMTYLNNSYWLSLIAIEGSMLFSFHMAECWSSGNIPCTEDHTVLCGFVLLFVLFLELLNMEKYFHIKKVLLDSFMREKGGKLFHYWENR